MASDVILRTTPRPTAPAPAPPVRQYSFTDWQVNNPTAPPPGDRLDAEFDRANGSITDTITWAGTSLNTDGSIRDGAVGSNQLQPGLFDNIADDAIEQVQPYVDQAAAYATAAGTSASDAEAAATAAIDQNTAAQGAANSAATSASLALQNSSDAQLSAMSAANSASSASNADNHATGEAAAASDYAVLTQAWAEHMPDTIPPNILAKMDVTGDHWSARWWANKAEASFGSLSSLYLGVWPAPPTSTALGEPIAIGAIYYDSTRQQPYVWDGTEWVPFYQPSKALTVSLAYTATAGQTAQALTVTDMTGNIYVINPTDPEPVEVYVNGVRLLNQTDYTLDPASSTVHFARGLTAGSIMIIDVLAPTSSLPPTRVTTRMLLDFDIDPATGNPGQSDGTRTVFQLALAADSSTATIGNAAELLVSVDGVIQQPGKDYNVNTDLITFGEAPQVGARAWAMWFAPTGETAPPPPLLARGQLQLATVDACVCPLGSVITSLLAPAAFAALLPAEQRGNWVLLDGRSIEGTQLAALTGEVQLPVGLIEAPQRQYVRVN